LFYPFFVFIYFNPGKPLFGLFANLGTKATLSASLIIVSIDLKVKQLHLLIGHGRPVKFRTEYCLTAPAGALAQQSIPSVFIDN
jgi:hypothetical protein